MVYKLLEEEDETKCPICLEIIAPGDQVHLDALIIIINIIIITINMANMIVDMVLTCPTRWWSLGAPPPSCTLAMLTAWRDGFRGSYYCWYILLVVMFGVLFFFMFFFSCRH